MMIKLGTIFRKVRGIVDKNCAMCKEDIFKLYTDGIRKGEVVVINPDYNCYGHITHYHVNVLDLRKEGDRDFLNKLYTRTNKHFDGSR